MTIRKDQSERTSLWHDLLEQKVSRRTVVAGATAAAVAATAPLHLKAAYAAPVEQRSASLPFTPIRPTSVDDIVLAPGFSYNVIHHYGSEIGDGQTIGYNHDWTGFYPIDLLDKGVDVRNTYNGFLKSNLSSTDGLLVVNHEYLNPMLMTGYMSGPKSANQIAIEKLGVGASVVRVRRNPDGTVNYVIDSQYNRSINANTPMLLTGPAASLDGGPNAIGTLANCSGGQTPWGTALSCEENFQDYATPAPNGYGWEPEIYGRRHYGYVVEIDPYDKASVPRKHTAMGRFRHENVAIRVGPDGTVVAYMGDDRNDACVYKFVADRKLTDPSDRAGNMKILESGKLYVADFGNGRWLELNYDAQARLRDAKKADGSPQFTSQADVLANARDAALALGGTPTDRPEDIEVHPLDSSVYIAFTNNTAHGNFHGQIVKLVEAGNEAAATSFDWNIFAIGGPQSGFSSPDNLAFDAQGNLWMVTDTSSSRLNKGIYKFMGNNSMFFFRTSGPNAGIAYQFASGPVEAEMTGPSWTPDGRTMFLAVQHPGEESKSLTELTSHWPLGGSAVPLAAVVAIRGFR
jgi:uncharacterized protein